MATTQAESAHAARERFGAAHAFTDPVALAQHPDVDLVMVTVKVPAHVELVTAALEAGKYVYCEWPLTRTSAEAAALAAAVEQAGVLSVVGLQARFAPAVARARAREMIADGAIGTVLSANLFSSRAKGGTLDVPAWTAYPYDATTGAIEAVGGAVRQQSPGGGEVDGRIAGEQVAEVDHYRSHPARGLQLLGLTT